jgi:hypothetical protein
VSPKRFKVRRRATRIRWRLSERARVTLRVNRCVNRRCTRTKRVGSFTRTRNAGKTTLRFHGRLRGKALNAGRYRLTAIPRDMAGNRGSTKRTSFRVKRRG